MDITERWGRADKPALRVARVTLSTQHVVRPRYYWHDGARHLRMQEEQLGADRAPGCRPQTTDVRVHLRPVVGHPRCEASGGNRVSLVATMTSEPSSSRKMRSIYPSRSPIKSADTRARSGAQATGAAASGSLPVCGYLTERPALHPCSFHGQTPSVLSVSEVRRHPAPLHAGGGRRSGCACRADSSGCGRGRRRPLVVLVDRRCRFQPRRVRM